MTVTPSDSVREFAGSELFERTFRCILNWSVVGQNTVSALYQLYH